MIAFISILMLSACEKQFDEPSLYEKSALTEQSNNEHGHLKQTKTFSDDVVISWLDMQLEMLRVPLAPGAGSQAANRAMGYCGIATYEAVVPGMPAYQSLTGQLNDFPAMPVTEPGKAYHWAASATTEQRQNIISIGKRLQSKWSRMDSEFFLNKKPKRHSSRALQT